MPHPKYEDFVRRSVIVISVSMISVLIGGFSLGDRKRSPDAEAVPFGHRRIAEGFIWLVAKSCTGGYPVFTGGCSPDLDHNRLAKRLRKLDCVFSFRSDPSVITDYTPGWVNSFYVKGAVRKIFELEDPHGTTIELSLDESQKPEGVRFEMNRAYSAEGKDSKCACTGVATGLTWGP